MAVLMVATIRYAIATIDTGLQHQTALEGVMTIEQPLAKAIAIFRQQVAEQTAFVSEKTKVPANVEAE